MISLKSLTNKTDINYGFFPSTNKIKAYLLTNNSSKKTPLFIIDPSIVKDRESCLRHELDLNWLSSTTIAYSFKTNYALAESYRFSAAEVVSEHELGLALKWGYNYSEIIYNGPFKENLEQSLSKPLRINLDNQEEVSRICAYQQTHPVCSLLGLRLNTNLHPSRFGFNIESGEALSVISKLRNHKINNFGLHIHLGSDIADSRLYRRASLLLSSFINSNRLYNLSYLDFGGGFPSHSIRPGTNEQSLPIIGNYINSITRPLAKLSESNCPLWLEPGRYLVDDATVMVSKVISAKKIDNVQHLVLDATINMLPSAWYHPLILKVFNKNLTSRNGNNLSTLVFGCTCQESDLLYKGRLPQAVAGDLIVFYSVGAYNQSQAAEFIYSSPETVLLG